MSISNNDYLNKLIAKAKKSWEGVDVERYMSDLRDDSFDKEVAENLSKEVASYITEQMKSNMKTIEERAKEWGEHIVETTPYDVVNGKACVFVEDRNIADVAEESYIAGAKDQQYIDRLLIEQLIDKACEWLEENARDYACATIRCPYGEEEEIICDVHREIVEDFRKAMEE